MDGGDQINLMVENGPPIPSFIIFRYLQDFKTSLESSILVFIYLLVFKMFSMFLKSSRFILILPDAFRKVQYLPKASTSLHIILELSKKFLKSHNTPPQHQLSCIIEIILVTSKMWFLPMLLLAYLLSGLQSWLITSLFFLKVTFL